MQTRSKLRAIALGVVLTVVVVPIAVAHIRIYPMQSTFGAREKYTMRVPNERQSATIRIEGEFPPGLDVYDFEFKPGWKIDFRKDAKGKIVGARWTGRIEPYEFVGFGMLAINPKDGNPNMLWKFYQYYEDGFKEEFTAPPDAKMPLRPMPQVILTSDASSASAPALAAINAPSRQDDLVATGKGCFQAYQCYECHGQNGEGTDDAPDLTQSKLTADQISKFLQKPSVDAENKGMPNVPADSPDNKALVAYVMSIRAK